MHAHQQNAFNAWWSQEHGTIDSQTGLVDALARAYGRAIWAAAIDAATHLPEAGKMVGDAEAMPPQAVHPKDDPAALWATIWRLREELKAAQAVPAEAVGHVQSINPMECTATIKWHPAQNGHFPDGFDIGSSLYLAPTPPPEAAAPSGATFNETLQEARAAVVNIPCDCSFRQREDGEHMSGCYLFDLCCALDELSTTPPQAPPTPPALSFAKLPPLPLASQFIWDQFKHDSTVRPELSLNAGPHPDWRVTPIFSADQMHAYALAALNGWQAK